MRAIYAFLVFVLAQAVAAPGATTLDVYFINVGHGDAILIDYGDWEALIDGGTSGDAPETERLAAEMRLLDRLEQCTTDRTIDLLILSHPHEDHNSFLGEVLANYEVLDVWYASDTSRQLLASAYAACARSLDSERPNMRALTYDERIPVGCFVWTVLGPAGPDADAKDDRAVNDNSLVLLLQYGAAAFLFSGDVRTTAEATLPDVSPTETAFVLLAPHHGYKESALPTLARHFDPDLVVFSTDDLTPDGTAQLAADGIPFLSTSTSGTVHIHTDGLTVWVTTDTLSGPDVQCEDP